MKSSTYGETLGVDIFSGSTCPYITKFPYLPPVTLVTLLDPFCITLSKEKRFVTEDFVQTASKVSQVSPSKPVQCPYLLPITRKNTVRHNTDREAQSMQEQWLSPKEAARYLGVNRSTLYKWSRQGRFTIRKLSGRASRINRTELDRLIEGSKSIYPRKGDECGTR